MNDNSPHSLSASEWQELMAMPEVQESWGLEVGATLGNFATTVYAVRFNFVSDMMPGYVGDLYVLHGNALTGDAPFVFRRDENGKMVVA